MGIASSPGFAAGLANAVDRFYAGQDRQRNQRRQDRRDQMLEDQFRQNNEQFQQNKEIRGLTLRKANVDIEKQAAQELYDGIVSGDINGGIQRHNELDPKNAITDVTLDPNDKTGDTFIIHDKDGALPYSLKKVGALFGHKDTHRYMGVGKNVFDTTSHKFYTPPGGGGLSGAKNANKVQLKSGQWKTDAEMRARYGQENGSWDPIMNQYTIKPGAMPYQEWYNKLVDPKYQWGNGAPNKSQSLNYQEASDRAIAEAESMGHMFGIGDKSIFGPGGRQQWITNRIQQLMGGQQQPGLSAPPTTIPQPSAPVAPNGKVDWRQFLTPNAGTEPRNGQSVGEPQSSGGMINRSAPSGLSNAQTSAPQSRPIDIQQLRSAVNNYVSNSKLPPSNVTDGNISSVYAKVTGKISSGAYITDQDQSDMLGVLDWARRHNNTTMESVMSQALLGSRPK